ncbi:lysylphosphatidylglycerol synthase transmembrane domain-containing protein [Clostridium ganghwense]|uniref:Phosphatidylglycerol lysyltransferase n=1 Tax=Clostridium ganghwense TaxID=312089 RepID=A0ABT4CR07_9CLOT|nr:lysylphosphatidylglycerol synthase transmembrane domain-containing protein [Clostridium ganghwense]MCY6371481.1 lysylphosphatidylglycerol synthase transmembrane domain-containing protein [Clostridium ganghwense]
MHEITKGNKKYIWNLVIMFILMLSTFYLLLKGNDIGLFIKTIKSINPIYVTLGFTMMFVFVLCESMNIRILLKSLGNKISFWRGVKYSFVGFYFSSITPSASGGQPMQVYYMNKDKINLSVSSLILLIIVAIYQIVMVMYVGVLYFWKFSFLSDKIVNMKPFIIFGFTLNSILVGIILIVVFSKKLAERIVNVFLNIGIKFRICKNKEKYKKKIDIHIKEYREGAKHIKNNPIILIKICVITIVQLTALFIIPYFIYKAFGLNEYGIIDVMAIQGVLTIAVASLPLPGAIGASESAFMTMFKILFSSTLLLPAMLVSRMVSFYLFLAISGVIVIGLQFKMNRRKRILE